MIELDVGGLVADWSKVWQGMEAVGTTGAFAVAAGVFVLEALRRRRIQAEQVTAWIECVGEGTALRSRVHVRNGSTEPIFGVRVAPTLVDVEPMFLAVLPPGRTHEEELGIMLFQAQGLNVYSADLALSFVDAGGRAWRRRAGGKLGRSRFSREAKAQFSTPPPPAQYDEGPPTIEEIAGWLSDEQARVYLELKRVFETGPTPVNVGHLARRLGLPEDQVGQTINLLRDMGRITTAGGADGLPYPGFVTDVLR